MDGPGPGDYKLYDSVTTKYRAENSIQASTWGTGRTIDYSPGKRKKAFYLPGPAHYNHVYPCQNEHRQFNKTSTLDEGYSFSKGPRDIQRRRYTEKEPPGAGTYEPQLPKTGTSKSFLGGPAKKEDKHNGFPTPGKHDIKVARDTPAWGMGKQ